MINSASNRKHEVMVKERNKIKTHLFFTSWLFIGFLLSLAACTSDQTQDNRTTVQTLVAIVSPTALPPTSFPLPEYAPPATPSMPGYFPPPKSPLPGIAILFKRGATSAAYQSKIQAGEEHIYTVRAQAGQTLIVSAASPGNTVFLAIKGMQGGQQFLSETAKSSYFSGKLPEAQDYQIALTTVSADTYYFFDVIIPANIVFKPGPETKKLDGYVEVDPQFPDLLARVRYLVDASAGQTMNVKLSSPELNDLSMGIYGQQDGQPYLRYEVKNSGFNGKVSVTQGYYLDVVSVSGKPTSFTLEVTLRPAAAQN
jgi:hypothetical protein